ncbi:uncharacterized protein LOC130629014 [Hydractinia symbiolongicarpus]|uniref:uncharacterized protein LOC130629014 n=1 Tax=Hydractinia symbiolongicarpus TaxID=13093 RepID=UPI002550DD8D|nr:uncharacterized protein LOC130629014 [Hydractinia symbiolongicarpus]
MFCFYLLILTVTLVSGKFLGDSCGGDYGDFKLHQYPSPLILQEGKRWTIQLKGEIKKAFPDEVIVEFLIKKKLDAIGYFTVPCINMIGSCSYKVTCASLDATMGKYGDPCPALPGSFKRTFYFNVPKIPVLVGFAGKGHYSVQISIKNKVKQLLSCTKTYINVSK